MHNDPLRAELRTLEDAASRVVPVIERWLKKLAPFCNSIVRGVPLQADDHLGFMALQFHAKQLGHAEAVVVLGDHPDTALIARSMLEGLCLLKWAKQDPVARGLQWRSFSLVIDWRFAKEEEKKDAPVMADKLRTIEQRIAEQGDALLSSKAIEARTKGTALPVDPYIRTWYRPQLRQVFEAVGAGDLYDGPYYFMSEWHHWSPGGLAQAMWFREGEIGYAAKSPMVHAASLANCFQCLVETSQLVNTHLGLGHDAAFADIINSYVADATSAGLGT